MLIRLGLYVNCCCFFSKARGIAK